MVEGWKVGAMIWGDAEGAHADATRNRERKKERMDRSTPWRDLSEPAKFSSAVGQALKVK